MKDIKEYLEKLKIKFEVFTHPPVYTCEEAEKHTKNIKGIHSKNLFLKDKKSKKFYLVILPASEKIDLKKLGEKLNNKLKFASESDLKQILNLTAGSVSPLGLINDSTNKVEVIIDAKVWNSKYVSFHPNINTETIELNKESFHKYIKSLKNNLKII